MNLIITIDRLMFTAADGLILEATRDNPGDFGRPGSTGPVWMIRLPKDVTDARREVDRNLPDFIRLEGVGDDLQAVRAGAAQVAASIASFRDRIRVAQLSLVGELGDVAKIALRAHDRPEDSPTTVEHLHRPVPRPDGTYGACCDGTVRVEGHAAADEKDAQ